MDSVRRGVRPFHEYNGLHWRTIRKSFDEDGMSTGQDVRKLYYSAAWQLIEEHVDDFETSSGSFTKERVMQQFWGLRYIDDAVMRRIDSNADGDYLDAGDRTYFHITDVQFSSVALINDAAALVERVSYDAYGRARHRPLGDIDGDGDVDGTSGSPGTGDQGLFDAAATTYNVDADFDRDLDTSSDTEDTAIFTAAHVTAALAVGRISDNSLDGPDNPVGYDGYLYNPEIEMYTVRFRHYHPEYGRWWERDPAEYIDGHNLYGYLGGYPLGFLDPLGLGPPGSPTHHHMIPNVGLELPSTIDRDAPEYGRIFGPGDHKYDTMHRKWNARWKELAKNWADEGIEVTKELIDQAIQDLTGDPEFAEWLSKSAPAELCYKDWDKLSPEDKLKRANALLEGNEKAQKEVLKKLKKRGGGVGKALRRGGKAFIVIGPALILLNIAEGQAGAIAIIDGINPIPISVEEMQDAIKAGQDAFSNYVDNLDSNIDARRMRNSNPSDVHGGEPLEGECTCPD